jgi:hypothetical protein
MVEGIKLLLSPQVAGSKRDFPESLRQIQDLSLLLPKSQGFVAQDKPAEPAQPRADFDLTENGRHHDPVQQVLEGR